LTNMSEHEIARVSTLFLYRRLEIIPSSVRGRSLWVAIAMINRPSNVVSLNI
jgi:hypothetical protein